MLVHGFKLATKNPSFDDASMDYISWAKEMKKCVTGDKMEVQGVKSIDHLLIESSE